MSCAGRACEYAGPAQDRQIALRRGRHRTAQVAVGDRACRSRQRARPARSRDRRLRYAAWSVRSAVPPRNAVGIASRSGPERDQTIENDLDAQRERAAGPAQPGDHAQREEGAEHDAGEPPAPPDCAGLVLFLLSPPPPPPPLPAAPSRTHHQSPTSLTSGSSTTPVLSLTLLRASSIKRAHFLGASAAEIHDKIRMLIRRRPRRPCAHP